MVSSYINRFPSLRIFENTAFSNGSHKIKELTDKIKKINRENVAKKYD